ncbi:hypothetical protein ACWEPL_53655 [Nonomuraea sp. NPDC004186]
MREVAIERITDAATEPTIQRLMRTPLTFSQRRDQRAGGRRVSQATGYRYLHEGIDVLASQAPDLHEVSAAAEARA